MKQIFDWIHNRHCVLTVVNFTLPDEKSNYVHRIGRVGRAERMGLAISLVATVPEKVNHFSCSNCKILKLKICFAGMVSWTVVRFTWKKLLEHKFNRCEGMLYVVQ